MNDVRPAKPGRQTRVARWIAAGVAAISAARIAWHLWRPPARGYDTATLMSSVTLLLVSVGILVPHRPTRVVLALLAAASVVAFILLEAPGR